MTADQSELPIDRGWAWLIVLGYFISIFCMAGLGRSFGIFMEEFESYFDTSVAMAALVMGVYGGVYTLTAPFCVAAGEKFTQRRVVMVGGVIGATGLCLGGLLFSIEWVIVIIGVLFGMGNASIFGNGLVMINQYFDKRRSLANGISLSGASIGQFVIPPLLQYLLDQYLLQGTLIIVGGMYLHVVVCGALYRPLSVYKKETPREHLIPVPDKKIESDKPSERANDRVKTGVKTGHDVIVAVGNTPNVDVELHSDIHQTQNDDTSQKEKNGVEIYEETASVLEVELVQDNIYHKEYLHGGDDAAQIERDKPSTYRIDNDHTVINSINGIREKVISKSEDFSRTYHKQHIPSKKVTSSFKTFMSGLFDFSVLKNHVVILFVTVSFLFFFGQFNFILFMPPTAYQRGLSKYQKAYLVSISGLCDLLGRLSVGALGDFKLVQRYKLLALSAGLCGVMVVCFSFAQSFLTMAICCGLYGFFGGGYVTINVPSLIDFVGLKMMPKVLGVVLFMQGIGAAIGQPLLGSIRDITGSYKVVHIINGLVMVSGTLLLLLYPVVRTRSKQ